MAGGALQLSSTLAIEPPGGAPDAGSGYVFQSSIFQTLNNWLNQPYVLSSNTPVPVAFPNGVPSATVLRVLTDVGPIDVEITTADGTLQTLPIAAGGKLEWACQAKPITAVTLVGANGQTSNVTVFLGTI